MTWVVGFLIAVIIILVVACFMFAEQSLKFVKQAHYWEEKYYLLLTGKTDASERGRSNDTEAEST